MYELQQRSYKIKKIKIFIRYFLRSNQNKKPFLIFKMKKNKNSNLGKIFYDYFLKTKILENRNYV